MVNLKLDHVHYRSSNFDASKKFYVDIMEAQDLSPEILAGAENLHFVLGGVNLLFAMSKEPIPTAVPASTRLGVYHIAFEVDSCDEATEYYKSRGAVVAKPPQFYSDTIYASFLTAPDGMMVELKEIVSKDKE